MKNFDPEPNLCPVNIKLFAYNNSKIPILGKCSLTLKHKKDHFDVSFIVVDSKSMPFLGLATSESLNLIKRISAVNVSDGELLFEFSDCFGEIWTLKNTHHIGIKDNVTPVVTPVRKIPLALKPKLEKELKRMVHLDIIETVQKPTDLVNGLLVVGKPNWKLQVCLDPRPLLNKAIKREHLPTAQEIFSQMSGASYFSKLGVSSSYWQIKVDEQSSNLLTFTVLPKVDIVSNAYLWNPFCKWSFSEESYFNYFGHTRQCEFPIPLRSMGENFTGTWRSP